MTDPTLQTTPPRDEAMPIDSVARNKALKVYTAACSTHGNRAAFDMAIREYLLASAPAPASGMVDAVERLEDKIEGLEADLASAVEVAFRRGAAEWTRLNYPALYVRLNAASLSPAATPVSEAEPGLAKGCCSASSPCFHQKHDPTTICEACRNAGIRAEELDKPASSPADGDVEAAVKRAWLAVRGQPVGGGDGQTYVVPPLTNAVMREIVTAALSQSTSAGRVGE